MCFRGDFSKKSQNKQIVFGIANDKFKKIFYRQKSSGKNVYFGIVVKMNYDRLRNKSNVLISS